MSAEISKAKDAVKDGAAQAREAVEDAGRDGARLADKAAGLAQKAERTANDLAEKAGDKAERLADGASDLAEEAGDRARRVAGSLRDTMRDAGDAAASHLSHAKEALSETGERIAETLRHSAERADLKKMQDSVVSAVTSGVSATANALRERDVAGLADDLRAAAKRHPGTFVLGAAAVGFIVGRFLLASRDEADRRRGGRY